jgi:hypothetical protein
MLLRLIRVLLVAGSLATLLVFATPQALIYAPKGSSASYQVSAKDLQVTCHGAAIQAGGSTGTSVTGFKRIGTTLVSSSYSGIGGTALNIFSKASLNGYGVRQDFSKRLDNSGSLTVVDSSGKSQQGSELLTANEIQQVATKSMVGLVGAPCVRPQSEFWLVGGSTDTGREALLVLTNPSRVDSTVDLEIYTENGSSHSAGLTGISVAAGKSTVLPLSSFVLSAQSIVVHVLSHGGSITALIQQKAVRGLFANGADYIYPATELAAESYFPGILIRGSSDSHKLFSSADKYSDVQQMLRVYVPGNIDAQISLQVLGTTKTTFGTVITGTAAAGKVTDFDITGLKDGDYFGILNSTVKLYSAIRLVRSKVGSNSYTDFTWLEAAQAFDTPRYVAIPSAGVSKLSIVNPGSKATVVNLKIGAATVSRTIAAGSTEIIRATPGLSIGIIPNGSKVYANLLVDVTGRITNLPVLNDLNISGAVQVSVH